jgi:hypothetical protein
VCAACPVGYFCPAGSTPTNITGSATAALIAVCCVFAMCVNCITSFVVCFARGCSIHFICYYYDFLGCGQLLMMLKKRLVF